jgi:hypothetical protein
MRVGIAGGFEDRRRAFLGQRGKKMPMARGQDGVHGDLHVAVGAVLDPHGHGEA